jgi:hypothetical protein
MAASRRQFAVSFRPSLTIRKMLRLGAVVRAVVVEPLGEGAAIISLRGRTTAAVSPLPLVRGQVLYAEVADIGERVHLRIVPPRRIGQARRTTTAAELARHLAGLGIEPTEAAVRLAAAMLSAELPITLETFGATAHLVHEEGRDDEPTAAAAAYVVRHGLAGRPGAVACVRAALFEPPCVGELLVALEAALASADPAASGGEGVGPAVRSLLGRIRSGDPAQWLACAVELCGEPAGWEALLAPCAVEAQGEPGEIAARLHAVLAGLHTAREASTTSGEPLWTLQVPFIREGTVATAFVELGEFAGEPPSSGLPARCTARAWVPLDEEGVALCALRVRDGAAKGRLRVTGAVEPGSVAAAAKAWLGRQLTRAGIELSGLVCDASDEDAGLGRGHAVPAVGLDFEI